MDEFDRSESLDEVRLGEFLETWFVNHFRDQDARLHKHLD
jgi:hemerythrin